MLRKHRLITMVVIVPNVIAIIYYFFIASATYNSSAQVVVETTLPHSGIGQSSLTSYAPERVKNAYTIKNIMLSWSAYQHIRNELPLRKWNASGDFITAYGGVDTFFSRSDVALWKYFDHHFSVSINKNDGVMSLKYTAYKPQWAQKILQSTLQYAIGKMKKMGQKVRESRLAAAKAAVASAQSGLKTANNQLSLYRKKTSIYNPKLILQNELHLLTNLSTRSAELSADATALSHAAPKSQAVSGYNKAIFMLNKKIKSAKQTLLLNDNIAHLYPVLIANQSIAERLLNLAKESEQKALTQADAPSFLAIKLSDPSLPIGSSGPDRMVDTMIIFGITLLLWSFLR
ncbi:hypothetical protein RIE95_05780 [Acidithiobacillus thiooxidans]|uniref:hypothetical protein n=2 Tax=Acidithiobacillus thiooxidans TaxID=930 RepID=UPI0028581F42|nr:hypothetical protein [Acidithiobacillus thiooxidans]MDR7926503.1 hypothetical protein [Acidithiobacillus thiooxidans]